MYKLYMYSNIGVSWTYILMWRLDETKRCPVFNIKTIQVLIFVEGKLHYTWSLVGDGPWSVRNHSALFSPDIEPLLDLISE